jgi:hypothetical protein
MDEYKKAKDELRDIDSRIDALQRRKKVLQQFIDIGESLYGDSNKTPGVALSGTGIAQATGIGNFGVGASLDRLTQRDSQRDSAKARILAASEVYLDSHGPMSTRDLVDLLEANDIWIGGADKVGTLSVLLSKSGLFVADRKKGWSTASAHKEKTPQGAGTPAGSDVGHFQSVPGEGTGSVTG